MSQVSTKTQTFQTGCADIDLTGLPWQITGPPYEMWIKRENNTFNVYKDKDCTHLWNNPSFDLPENQRCGLYFYLVAPSNYKFKLDLPVDWGQNRRPSDITYGKIRNDRQAFSMMDHWTHLYLIEHAFDLQVEGPDGGVIKLRELIQIDPKIIERGDEPPTEPEPERK